MLVYRRLEKEALPDKIPSKHVCVRFEFAPINPADLNMVEGTYPIKPAKFPAIGGNEVRKSACRSGGGGSVHYETVHNVANCMWWHCQGVGEIMGVGDGVKSMKVGDVVLPSKSGAPIITHPLAMC